MKKIMGVIAIAVVLGWAALPAAAQEQKFEIRAGESIKTVLDDAVGKPVTLLMISGAEVSGTVAKVGDSAVQLTRLGGGRDFFDGVILLERVDGVIMKVRGK